VLHSNTAFTAALSCEYGAADACALQRTRASGAGKTSLAHLLAHGVPPADVPLPTQGCDVFVRLMHVPDPNGGACAALAASRARGSSAAPRAGAAPQRACAWGAARAARKSVLVARG
jgi:hypothetical protein